MEGIWGALITALASTGVVGLFARGAQRGRSAQVEGAINRLDRVLRTLPAEASAERQAVEYARRLEVASLLSLSAVPGGLVWRPVLYFFLYVLGASALFIVAIRLLFGRLSTGATPDPSFQPVAGILIAVAFVLEVACGVLVVTQTLARRRERIVDDFMQNDVATWSQTRFVRYSPGFRARMKREAKYSQKTLPEPPRFRLPIRPRHVRADDSSEP